MGWAGWGISKTLRVSPDLLSLGKHHSKGIIAHGYQDCAENPVPDEEHKEHVRKAAQFVRNLAPDTEVIPVFVAKKEGNWKILPL